MRDALDRRLIIPSGSELRVLLSSDHISYGEVGLLLRQKGVYVGNSDKSVTVPLLSATLLTYDQFLGLVESSVERESRPKIKLSALELVNQNSDWVTPLKKELFSNEFDITSKLQTIQIVDAPSLVVGDQNKVTIPYVIKRNDFSKDWISRELEFGGEITIERVGNSLKLDFSSTHSSRETEYINRRLISHVSKILNDRGVTQSKEEKRIRFGGFSNEERVRFFKRLTGGLGKILKSGNVNDMEINLDVTAPPLPNDPQIAWMNQTVKRLKIDGDRLNNIFLISDEKYYQYYHVQRMDVTYAFSSGTNDGTCRVAFFFSTPSRSDKGKDDSELTFEILKLNPDMLLNADARKKLMALLYRALRGMVEAEYDKICGTRGT